MAQARRDSREHRARLPRARGPAHHQRLARSHDHVRRSGTGSRGTDVGDRLGAVCDQPRARPAVHAFRQSAGRHQHSLELSDRGGGGRALARHRAFRRDRHVQPGDDAEPRARFVRCLPRHQTLGARRCPRPGCRRPALRLLAVHDRPAPRPLQPRALRGDTAARAHARGRDPGAPATTGAHARPARRAARGGAVLHRPGDPAHRGGRRDPPRRRARGIATRFARTSRSSGARSHGRSHRPPSCSPIRAGCSSSVRVTSSTRAPSMAPTSTSRIRPTSLCRRLRS